MKDMGDAQLIIGLQIHRIRSQRLLQVHQTNYVEGTFHQFGMAAANGGQTPLELGPRLEHCQPEDVVDHNTLREYQSRVGKLMYAMIGTRPDIAFTVSTLAKFTTCAGSTHLQASKRVLRYLKSCTRLGLTYEPSVNCSVQNFKKLDDSMDVCEPPELLGVVDADWAGDRDSRRSTTGFIFTSDSAAISWKSRLQSSVALSTTEAEYMALTEAVKEGVWLRRLYQRLLVSHIKDPKCSGETSSQNTRS